MGDYALVTKKLNLDNKNTTTVEVAKKSPESQKTAVLTVLDKHLITIKILNSTETSGLASSLEKKIIDEGFIVSKTGNESTNYEITTLLIQENKSEYSSTLLDAIQKTYPKAVAKTTTEASDVDAVIIIGNN
ncbi:MAG: LytR C-terminal domain-containing protein [Candidatus Nomurabacteria bacterium]|nr:LytR C-terminal domain-containing protein [Candidatus Nomurabacteria bacterium]